MNTLSVVSFGLVFVVMIAVVGKVNAGTSSNKKVNTVSFMPKNAKSITVMPDNPIVKISLKSNATTGYRWTADYDKQIFLSYSKQFISPKTKLIGASGHEVWTFKVNPRYINSSGVMVSLIKMKYARPWENKIAKKAYFQVWFDQWQKSLVG
jgi:predicted secreted protein